MKLKYKKKNIACQILGIAISLVHTHCGFVVEFVRIPAAIVIVDIFSFYSFKLIIIIVIVVKVNCNSYYQKEINL